MKKCALTGLGLLLGWLLQPAYAQLCPTSANPALYHFEWITRVELHDGSNSSGQGHYSDFSTQSDGSLAPLAVLEAGESYTIEIDVTSQVPGNAPGLIWYVQVWIDFDHSTTIDYDVALAQSGQTNEEYVFGKALRVDSQDTVTFMGTITVPNCKTSGISHVRVTLHDTPFTPCGNYNYGETEDYVVMIQQNKKSDLLPSGNAEIRFWEDSVNYFEVTDFPHLASYDTLLRHIFIYIPDQGFLQVNGGSPFTSNRIVRASDISSLSFRPEPNAFGDNYTQFRFFAANHCNIGVGNYTFTIHIEPVDDPTILMSFETYVAEFEPQGTLVGNISATDVDDDAFSYAITAGNPGNAFQIDSTGEVSVQHSDSINYASRDKFTLTITVTSAPSGAINTTEAVIHIMRPDHPTTVMQASFFLKEFPSNGHIIGQLSVYDPDDQTFTYAITDNNPGNTIGIDTNTGQLFVQDSSLVNTDNHIILRPEIRLYDSSTGEEVAQTTPNIHILRPTWDGVGTYHSDTYLWNIMRAPTDPQDRVLIQRGMVALQDQDVSIRSLELGSLAKGSDLLVRGGKRLRLYEDYLQVKGTIQVTQDSFIEIRGKAINSDSTSLSNSTGNVLLLQGLMFYLGP